MLIGAKPIPMEQEARRKPTLAGGRPFPESEEPRLGIIHLIGGITCVAVYLGLQQAVLKLWGPALADEATGILFKTMLLFSGLGAGIALGGPCLLLARVVRGVPFPIHPGDHLLVLWGVNSGLFLLGSFVFLSEYPAWWMFGAPLRLVGAVICLWAANAVETGRWRAFFLLMAGVQASGAVLCCMGPVVKPPFWAAPLQVGDVGTCGGAVTDEHARVLRPDGSAIEGLYASGNCASPIAGAHYVGAGHSIGCSSIFGMIAAKHMAA